MLWLVFALLLGIGLIGLIGDYSLLGGGALIVMICLVAAVGIYRIGRMRAGR